MAVQPAIRMALPDIHGKIMRRLEGKFFEYLKHALSPCPLRAPSASSSCRGSMKAQLTGTRDKAGVSLKRFLRPGATLRPSEIQARFTIMRAKFLCRLLAAPLFALALIAAANVAAAG